MSFLLNKPNLIFLIYVILMLLGLAVVLWQIFRQDKEKDAAVKQKERKAEEMLKASQNAEARLKESAVKINNLYNEIEILKGTNEKFKSQYKELDDKLSLSDSELQLTKESLSTAETKSRQESQKTKSEIEKQIKDTQEKLARATLELEVVKKETDQFKESCQILEKALKNKEGVFEEELPHPIE